ncbi:PhzF family phenazine biosynthesis protein [Sporosarcina sp.]|uniref:PhzF family phenazine biosynthesis protein n=1 Tax=Sporosarcina sp. TaxID=49982 RepID=UPI00262ACC2A|nr:PhzF family phenazine biosynthesis protein [Sporosarcina sp.]
MKWIKVHHYDAFSKLPNKGNPAGVVLNGGELSDEEMQEIAYKAGFNETAFLLKSEAADLKIRFFTPGQEMNLCGHATMATIYALKTKGLLGNKKEFTLETKAGILPIKINTSPKNEILITMKQASPQFREFKGCKEALANSIGLAGSDINDSLPILYGSTGAWTLLIPIKELEAFKRMRPDNQQFPSILKEMPKASLHPFCLQTYDKQADMHARHFSSPYSGTVEDAVTGTASGVIGVYFIEYIKHDKFDGTLDLVVEQGLEIDKDGRVMVRVSKSDDSYDVEITGNAVFVKDFDVLLE